LVEAEGSVGIRNIGAHRDIEFRYAALSPASLTLAGYFFGLPRAHQSPIPACGAAGRSYFPKGARGAPVATPGENW
jgi:hypothetical protein